MAQDTLTLTLLDYLAYRSRPVNLSDLHNLSGIERRNLVRALEGISPECVSLREWNDALDYLASVSPARSQTEARDLLLKH